MEISPKIRQFGDVVMRMIEKIIVEKNFGAAHDALLYARVDLMNMDTTASPIPATATDNPWNSTTVQLSHVGNVENWVVAEVELVEPFLYMTPLVAEGCEAALEDENIQSHICNCIPADKLAEGIHQHILCLTTNTPGGTGTSI